MRDLWFPSRQAEKSSKNHKIFKIGTIAKSDFRPPQKPQKDTIYALFLQIYFLLFTIEKRVIFDINKASEYCAYFFWFFTILKVIHALKR